MLIYATQAEKVLVYEKVAHLSALVQMPILLVLEVNEIVEACVRVERGHLVRAAARFLNAVEALPTEEVVQLLIVDAGAEPKDALHLLIVSLRVRREDFVLGSASM